MTTDAEALDRIADLFRLPDWQWHGSGASFIEVVADVLGEVRSLDGEAPADLREEAGYSR